MLKEEIFLSLALPLLSRQVPFLVPPDSMFVELQGLMNTKKWWSVSLQEQKDILSEMKDGQGEAERNKMIFPECGDRFCFKLLSLSRQPLLLKDSTPK